MALVLGTNCGFVVVAPIADPADLNRVIDGRKMVGRDTSDPTAIKITEIGWWCDTASEEANFEVGLYAADGIVVPGEAGTRLYVDNTNAKGVGAGWKRVTGLDWEIDPSTTYWIAVQLDNTATTTYTNYASSGGSGYDSDPGSSLPDPYGGGTIWDNNGMIAIYAVWEAAAGEGNPLVKIAGTFENKPIKVKIGGAFVEKTLKVKVGGVFQ